MVALPFERDAEYDLEAEMTLYLAALKRAPSKSVLPLSMIVLRKKELASLRTWIPTAPCLFSSLVISLAQYRMNPNDNGS